MASLPPTGVTEATRRYIDLCNIEQRAFAYAMYKTVTYKTVLELRSAFFTEVLFKLFIILLYYNA